MTCLAAEESMQACHHILYSWKFNLMKYITSWHGRYINIIILQLILKLEQLWLVYWLFTVNWKNKTWVETDDTDECCYGHIWQ